MKFFLLLLILASTTVWSDESRMSLEEAKKNGFEVFKFSDSHLKTRSEPVPHALKWPFEKPYRHGFLGNNFVQYQPYGMPGYHMGSDMVLERDSWVLAPLSGRIEAGGYTYTDLPDGTNIKQWLPWPKGGGAYFEVAVISDAGYRYEFHHVSKESLPREIVNILNAGGGRVEKGQRLGQVYQWSTPFHYDHVHVNVYGPEGKQLNPEYFYEVLPDDEAPAVNLVAEYVDGRSSWIDTLDRKPVKRFIVMGSDKKNNSIFSQAPIYLELKFENGGSTVLDFRYQMLHDIRKVYPARVRMPDGSIRTQMRDFYPNSPMFYMALDLPADLGNGNFMIRVQDIAGNETSFNGSL